MLKHSSLTESERALDLLSSFILPNESPDGRLALLQEIAGSLKNKNARLRQSILLYLGAWASFLPQSEKAFSLAMAVEECLTDSHPFVRDQARNALGDFLNRLSTEGLRVLYHRLERYLADFQADPYTRETPLKLRNEIMLKLENTD